MLARTLARAVVGAIVMHVAVVCPLSAQTDDAVGPPNVISANPFLPLFGYFSGEFEHRIKNNVSFAVAGSHTKFDNRNYTSADAKLRLYPSEKALEGFGIAAGLGFGSIKRENVYFYDCVANCPLTTRTISSPTFMIEVGYQWLLGRSRATALTAGFGAKRYLGGRDADYVNIERVTPMGRLSIGYAF